MTDVDESTEPVDGRVARRQRNIDTVLDAVLDLFVEDMMFPTIDQVATRSGLSLRSLYRYFADPGELLEAAISRTSRIGVEQAQLHAIGQGPLDERIEDFTTMRLRVHEAVGPVFRATLANAVLHPRIRQQLASDRERMQEQFRRQFATELDALPHAKRDAVLSAGDLLTQLESIEFLRRHRGLSVAETHSAVATGLRALLD